MTDRARDDAPRHRSERVWVSPHNLDARARPARLDREGAYIYDVTLRDGEQYPGVSFSREERVRIGVELAEIGVARIETGLPIVSRSVFDATRELAGMGLPAQFVPQCRADMDDVRLTAETGTGAIVIVHTINPLHCRHVFGLDEAALVDKLVAAVAYAKSQGLHTSFMAADVFRCDLDYLLRVYGAVVEGAHPDVIVATDTVGCATPWAVELVVEQLRAAFPGVAIEFHGHDDFGLGTATALAAVRAGADGVQCSFNGLGERTGNAPTEEVVAALELAMDVRTGVDVSRLRAVSELIQDLSQVRVPLNKPIVGPGIFTTESHIVAHIQDLMQRETGIDTGMYAFSPSLFGHGDVRFVLGKGSGPTSVRKTAERLGVALDDAEVKALLERVKDEGRLRKSVVDDHTFLHLLSRLRAERESAA
jgi:isopropylmalate/homocitrate/citramalate synthase